MTMSTALDRHLHRSSRCRTQAAQQGKRHRPWKRRVATITMLLAGTVLAEPSAVRAAPSADGSRGVDVSYPECGERLPSGQAFAIVGVNGGRPNTSNPCLARQLAWAAKSLGGTPHDDIQLYVNTANPGAGNAAWPQSGSNQYGTCDGSDSRSCAFEYGWERAVDDATSRGITDPEQYMWWLDVEIANSWDYSDGGRARNAAVL